MNSLKPCRASVYTQEQIEMIAGHHMDRNALATRIAYAAGLRECELISLLPVGERTPSPCIQWFPERFLGREGIRYTVVSEDGLVREVLIPHDLAAQLGARRLAAPVAVGYRGKTFERHYDIGVGKAWGKLFARASKQALGWSGGYGMLRASYARQRMRELHAKGMMYRDAKAVCSQEMGMVKHRIEGLICESTTGRGRSKLDKFRVQIEYIRYELKSPINEIHLWLRRIHHLTASESTIWRRLAYWKEGGGAS